MSTREDLQTLLETLTTNVYFQPPESFKMSYPCIVYARTKVKTKFADNKPYQKGIQYSLTVIDPDPDSIILDQVEMLSMCVHDRHFVADNLYHDIYNLYY